LGTFRGENPFCPFFKVGNVSGLAEEVVADGVLLTLVVAEELCAGNVECAPKSEPLNCVFWSVSLSEKWKNFSFVLVHSQEPVLGCLLVVFTIDAPILNELQVILKLRQQIVCWHLSPCEKIPTHPVRCIASDEVVTQAAMRENMSEKQAPWF